MSKDLRPIWLLDIDGVINVMSTVPNPKSLRLGTAKQKYLTTKSGTFRLRVNNDLVDFINRVHASNLVEIQWATTWSDEANTVFAPEFGLPTLPVGARPGWETGRFDDHTWKAGAARRVIQSRRKLIWTDDEAISDDFERLFTDKSAGHLLIKPDPVFGLTPEHCEVIAGFIGLT